MLCNFYLKYFCLTQVKKSSTTLKHVADSAVALSAKWSTVRNWDIGSISTAWIVTSECLSKRKRWCDTTSGTVSERSPSSTDSCVTVRWTTAARSTAAVPTMAAKPTITVSRYAEYWNNSAKSGSTIHVPVKMVIYTWGLSKRFNLIILGKICIHKVYCFN